MIFAFLFRIKRIQTPSVLLFVDTAEDLSQELETEEPLDNSDIEPVDDSDIEPETISDIVADEPSDGWSMQEEDTELLEALADTVVAGEDGLKGADAPSPKDEQGVDDTPEDKVEQSETLDSGEDGESEETATDEEVVASAEDEESEETATDEEAVASAEDEESEATVADEEVVASGEEEESEETVADEEEREILGEDIILEPQLLSEVKSGYYTVDATGKVEFTFIFDSGAYEGQLAAISMTGMENLDLNSSEFFQESLQRALSGSEAKLGYIVIDDISAGAMFSGELEPGFDYNHGEFPGAKEVEFNAGDKFFLMLIPNGSVAEVVDALEQGITKDVRPLFSLVAANPTKAIQMGQIIDVTGDGNTYVFEDIREDGASDKDFNDLIFQVKGATITTVTLDDLILEGEMSPEADWRNTEIGQQIVDYAASQVVIAPEPNPVEKYEFPKEDQPLVGFIDTHFTQGNPDIDYSRIIFGKDYIQNDSDPTVVAVAGEGTHGDHILGIVAATQDNGLGIDGLNDDAPLWVSSAVESGKWADALVEFVDAAKASNQPNAIINLSIDLTQVNPDGTVTTRYEFTPQERGAIEYARQNGVLIVAAAGNDGGVMSVLGQASQEFDNIITVGAAKSTVVPGAVPEFTRAEYSSFGNGLDVMAEGGTIDNPVISTAGDSLGVMAGTSVAAAKVTGVTSQVWAANPELSYRQVISILKQSATDLGATGWDTETGFGLVNIAAAVGLAKTTIPEVYKPTPWFAPDTWSGEGIATPMERAVGRLDGISTSGRHQYFGSSNSIDEITFTLNRSIFFQFTTDNGSIRLVDSNGNTRATSSASSAPGKANLNPGSYKIVANYASSSSSKMIKLNFDDLPPTTPFLVSRTIPATPTSGGGGGGSSGGGGGQIIIPPPPVFTDGVGFDGVTYHMTYRNTYFAEGGQSALGTRRENVFRNGAGYMQHFTGGSKGSGAIMKSDVSDASYWVGGEIWKKFNEGGSINRYGYPISAVSYRGGVPFQQFQRGTVQLAPFPGENKVPSNAVYVNTVASITPNRMTAANYNYNTGQLVVQPSNNSSSWYEKGTAIIDSITNSITKLIPKPSKNINLVTGTTLTRGQELITPSGYKFIFQTDGNLVLRDPKGKAIWATGTNGKGADRFSVQNDGNVVLYAGKEVLWATGTENNRGAYFSIQDDGNLVVYSSSGRAIFNTGTNGGREGTRSASAQWLRDRNLRRFPGLQFSTVISKATNKALDAGGSNDSVYQHPSPNSSNEFHQWGFEKVGDYYMIINKATGKALDAGGSGGTLPYAHPDPNRNNPFQHWTLTREGDAYLIINRATGHALDSGGDNGNQIYMYPTPLSWNPFHLWMLNLPNSGGGGNSTLAVLDTKSRLTVDEIRQYRQLVAQLPQSQRPAWYRKLQYKTPYFNQRDNGYTSIADVMCNVTSLASCLTYLGVKNPTPSRQFEDVLEDILRNNPTKYPSTNGINARYWWDNLSKLATSEFGVNSSGTRSFPGFPSTDINFFKNFVNNNWQPALDQGKAIMAGVSNTSAGHIVKVIDIDWNRGGIIVDDPYGNANTSVSQGYSQLNTSNRGSISTQSGQDEGGVGNDNFWSWSYCAKVFGATWYLTLG